MPVYRTDTNLNPSKLSTGRDLQKCTPSRIVTDSAKSHSTTCTPADPTPKNLAVLPTIRSPHFETVTFLAQDANVNSTLPSNKFWRRIDEALTALGRNLLEKHGRELKVVFDGWEAPAEDESARQGWMELLPKFAEVGKITFKSMDPPPHTYDPPTWHSLTREVVKGKLYCVHQMALSDHDF